ncbi:G patch domain-containing protein 11-like [Ptychodera flava]|uniref:G patch domain-containing protein 11-like n=1 Tax=Ptychodera flava TaxID=63121 RepID=UPI003969C04B
MSSDEEDYMSDSFLLKCESVRPGLVPDKIAKQYKKENAIKEKNLKSKTKPLKVKEKEHLEEGLNKELSSNNKGFALLQKMGYKKGMGLGKEESGRSEPVPLEIKTGRGGLGRETAVKRQQAVSERLQQELMRKRMKREELDRGDFLQRMSEKFADRETEKDLHKSRKACEQLDRAKDVEQPDVAWFWPIYKTPKSDESEEEGEDAEEEEEEPGSDLTVSEKLQELTTYLRKTHYYCIWCGTAYNDCNDLLANCPGDDAEAHR